ncbi:MAG: diguanylate cyclase [Oscillochloridaceae bacterium umkhey_bin13]
MRVLVADDDPLARYAISALVQAAGYPVVTAEDGVQAWEIIQAEPITLLITDWQMPGLDGPDLIRRIRAAGLPRYVSCLLLTVRDQRTDRLLGLDAGADDYLVKPVDPDELRARLAIAHRILNLEQDLRAANSQLEALAAQLRYHATHDALTGLLNRRGLEQQAARVLGRAERSIQPVAVALIDLDHFKQINDQHGHAVGDQALAHLAAELRDAVRPYDLLGRWGGEEFLLILPGVPSDLACSVAERLRAHIAATPLVLDAEQRLHLRVSIGVAICPGPLLSLDRLLITADEALYAAKAAGRNRVCCTVLDAPPD